MLGPSIKFLPKNEKGEGLLPWVIAVMVFLTALATASAVAIGGGLDRWSVGLTTSLSVQVVNPDATARAKTTEDALRLIRATPGVADANVLADASVLKLLSPWIGDLESSNNLPIPTLIEVNLISPDSVNILALKQRLRSMSSSIRLDDHQAWLSQIYNLASTVRIMLSIAVVMIALSTIAIVIFGCRAGLATHAKSIEIMHLIGAEDSVISKAFDALYLEHGLKGGTIGVLIAAIALFGLNNLVTDFGQGLISAAIPTFGTLWWLILLPIVTCVVTMMTARVTVRHALLKLM